MASSTNRPYINFSADQLCEETNRKIAENSCDELKALDEEIGRRSRSRRKLDLASQRIQEHLRGYSPKQRTEKEKNNPKKIEKKIEKTSSKKTSTTTTKPDINPQLEIHTIGANSENPLPKKEEITTHTIRPCNPDLNNTPEAWFPQPKDLPVKDLSREELLKLTWPERLFYSLDQWIIDRRKGGGRFFPFASGEKALGTTNKSESSSYALNITSNPDEMFEGSAVTIKVGQKRFEARISGIITGEKNQIVISTEEDLGETLGQGQIIVDDTAMSKHLRDIIGKEAGISLKETNGESDEDNAKPKRGLLFDFSARVLENKYQRISTEAKILGADSLNKSQAEFVYKALSNDISILWGPPGTGKTQTLTSVIKSLTATGEKTLICSNTNMAVDQVFLKACRDKEESEYIENQKMIRLGNISHQDLISNYGDKITIEGISETLGEDLKQKRNKLSLDRKNLLNQSEQLLDTARRFDLLDQTSDDIKRRESEFNLTRDIAKAKREEATQLQQEIATLNQKLSERTSGGGGLGGLFGRSPEQLRQEIEGLSYKLESANTDMNSYRDKLNKLQHERQRLSEIKQQLERQLNGINRETISHKEQEIKESVNNIDAKIQSIDEELKALSKTIIDNALVVGTSLAKCCMSLSEIGFYDNVIIDEASMASIPMVFIAASLAHKRVILSGDFSQLSPICSTDNLSIKDVIGKSIFEICGIEESVRSKASPSGNLGFLDVQYRMNSKICELISNYMYDGRLETGTKSEPLAIVHPSINGIGELVVIDTSTLLTFSSSSPSGSKLNLIHAYIAKKFLSSISKNNTLSLGYCTPFAAQAKLFKTLLSDEDKKAISSIGTVHKFQGDERDLLVYDTVVAQSDNTRLGPFLNSDSPSQEGAKNLNVAISRARKSLVVIADLRIMDAQLPKNAFLRNTLASIQEKGLVIDARDIVSVDEISAVETELRVSDIKIAKESILNGMVDEEAFFPLLYKCFEEAKDAIIIFSGFFTPKRVAEVLDVLKRPLENGVAIKFVLPTNNTNGSFGSSDPSSSFALVSTIRAKGIVVEQRRKLHQKAVLIDDSICWYGSLNPLSFAGTTLESMLLVRQEGIALQVAEDLALPGTPRRKTLKEWVQPEPPPCPKCGSQTVFAKSRYGPFFPCEREGCDGRVSINRR